MQIKLPYPLSDSVLATLSLKLSVGREMQMHAGRLGYGPEELQNLINQKTQEIARTVAEAMGLEYDVEPE